MRLTHVAALALIAAEAHGQSSSTATFEVVSIRPHAVGPAFVSSNTIKGNTYRGVAITLTDLIEDAYHLQRNQISGGPVWVTSDRFDIEARAAGEEALVWDRARLMLQSALADRFRLRTHREMKEVAAYDLVVAKSGPKFKEGADSAAQGFTTRADPSGIHITATRAIMARLTEQLAFSAGRPVVDKTGLAGGYKFQLDYVLDNSPAAADGSAPTLFTAIEEQLGLKLQPSRTMQEMLVIESAGKPSAN